MFDKWTDKIIKRVTNNMKEDEDRVRIGAKRIKVLIVPTKNRTIFPEN